MDRLHVPHLRTNTKQTKNKLKKRVSTPVMTRKQLITRRILIANKNTAHVVKRIVNVSKSGMRMRITKADNRKPLKSLSSTICNLPSTSADSLIDAPHSSTSTNHTNGNDDTPISRELRAQKRINYRQWSMISTFQTTIYYLYSFYPEHIHITFALPWSFVKSSYVIHIHV